MPVRATADRDPAAPAVTVVVPTRDRPEKLGRCLEALAAARHHHAFDAVVCDSSLRFGTATRAAVAEHPWARYRPHTLDGPGAARNLGAQEAQGTLLVYVDDDVYVEPPAIAALVTAALDASQPSETVVAGTVDWGAGEWSGPKVMRRIGHARDAAPGEPAEWFISALLCVPRELALSCPWDEARRYYDDRFMCLQWRRDGVDLRFCPQARARHDDDRKTYPLAQERHRIYANLYDAILLRRSLWWVACFELLGFAAAAKRFARSPAGAVGVGSEWLRGTARFVTDLPRLQRRSRRAR